MSDTSKQECPTCGSPDRDKPYTSHFAGIPISDCMDPWHSQVERCPICDWPIAESPDKGCRPGNCSYRPHYGTAEYYRIQKRRDELKCDSLPVELHKKLMSEIDAGIAAMGPHPDPRNPNLKGAVAVEGKQEKKDGTGASNNRGNRARSGDLDSSERRDSVDDNPSVISAGVAGASQERGVMTADEEFNDKMQTILSDAGGHEREQFMQWFKPWTLANPDFWKDWKGVAIAYASHVTAELETDIANELKHWVETVASLTKERDQLADALRESRIDRGELRTQVEELGGQLKIGREEAEARVESLEKKLEAFTDWDKEPDALLGELKYIADSPAPEHGGFHERVTAAARGAVSGITSLRARVESLTQEKADLEEELEVMTKQFENAGDRYEQFKDRAESLGKALRWALGEEGDFRARNDGEGAYWWRKELRERSGITSEALQEGK